MPVTPFHFGVGILFKGAAPRQASLLTLHLLCVGCAVLGGVLWALRRTA